MSATAPSPANGTAEVIEGTAVEVYRQPAPSTLFRTEDPVEVIEKATAIANALKRVVASRGLITNIKGKEHPRVEAWQTLGSMLGVFPVPAKDVETIPWPHPVPERLRVQHDRGLNFGYTASYRAQRPDGAMIGGGEADCKRTESKWADSDDYAVKSMAQTRAISKALSSPLRFVMALAGYETTPAEEMPADGFEPPSPPTAPNTTAQPPQRSAPAATGPQKGAISGRCNTAGLSEDQRKAILQWVAGTAVLDRVSKKAASGLIDRLGKDGSGAAEILAEIDTEIEAGEARALAIASRYFEAPHGS